ncbi:MAG: hypothetical protein LBP59_03095, partial [Planctomycetaceae bacterium]|nr:hypothetical protein [Planctomycetaceae bacterium]
NNYQNDIYYQRLCEKIGEKHPIEVLTLLAVLRICKGKKNLAEAGKILFSNDTNPSSRIRKFLHKFNLKWEDVNEIIGQL